jgi:hypothetical protein
MMKVILIVLAAAFPAASWFFAQAQLGQAQPGLESRLYRFEDIQERLAYLTPESQDQRAILIPEDWLPTEAGFGDVLAVARVLEQGSEVTMFSARIELVRE